MSKQIEKLQLENQRIRKEHHTQLQLLQTTNLPLALERRLREIEIHLKTKHNPYQESYDSGGYDDPRPTPYHPNSIPYHDPHKYNKRNLPLQHPYSDSTTSPPSKRKDFKPTPRKTNNND